jgi:Caspase domain
MNDYAVVVGVERYPGFSVAGVTSDLNGPNNDAQAIYDWIVAQDGGGVDPNNATLIRSAQFDPIDPSDPKPAMGTIEQALRRVHGLVNGTGGNRLYLYFSGHGFAPVLEEGALFTAEASQAFPFYVYAHSWLRGFRRAGAFREFVLWMDCCMNPQLTIPVNEVVMRPSLGTGVPGPAFVGLAAQTKSALEHAMADGKVHGVFTWTLLEGLRGGAANDRGRVTGESLRNFLHNAMPEFLPESVRNSAAVDLHPFIRADQGILFRRLPARSKFTVRLEIPGATPGQMLKIWTGRPHAAVVTDTLTGPEWTGALVRGLYVAEVSEAGLRQGFQVSGAGAVRVTVTEPGPAAVPSDGSTLFALNVVAENPAAAIAVTDYRFELVFTETGELHETDLPGVYKIRVQFGRDIGTISEEVVLLDRDQHRGKPAVAPHLPSPAPIPGSALTHEYHEGPFADAAEARGAFRAPTAGAAAISVLARYWTDPAVSSRGKADVPHPMKGLELLGSDGSQEFLTERCQVDEPDRPDPLAVSEREVSPGVYFLRQYLDDGRAFEGTVVAVANWTTQVVIQRSTPAVSPPGIGIVPAYDVAVFMRASNRRSRIPRQDATVEGARLALAQGRNVFGEGRGVELQDLLLRKYEDPIAAMIGCHLLLYAMDADPNPDRTRSELFDGAVASLLNLVGPGHPDVAALSLRASNPELRVTKPFTAPPIFSRSWELITDASYERPELVPADIWKRAHAWTQIGPFMVWAIDENTRSVHANQLSRWIKVHHGTAEPESSALEDRMFDLGGPPEQAAPGRLPAAALEAARKAHVPAAAAALLWEGT